MTTTYIVVSFASGILFGFLDGLLNGNPLANRLYAVYKPIARDAVNIRAGILIDILYGFALAGIFLVLYQSLPGETGFLKGISFGLLVWFLRVIMSAVSQWMMYTIPVKSLLYSAAAGLVEMLLIGIVYGLFLRPAG